MDVAQVSDKVATAKLRAAQVIQQACDRFEHADILTSKCPKAEMVYGIGTDKGLCPQCGQNPADHGLVSNFADGHNPATLLQQEVQRQISEYKGDLQEFHPDEKADVTYGYMECIDRFGDLRTYFTCSGNPTGAVTAAMRQLKSTFDNLIWVATVPHDNALTGYSRATGKPVPIKLAQVDNPPNVCAACKLLQFAMSERLAPISLTETYGRSGNLKPSCRTCTQNIVQMMCGQVMARQSQLKDIKLFHDEIILSVEQQQAHDEAVESWKAEIIIGKLKPKPDQSQFSRVYDYVAQQFGEYYGTLPNQAMVQLITSEEFLTAFQENPEAREEIPVVARAMLDDDKPNLRERQLLNKAKARDRKKEKKSSKSSASAAASSAIDDDDAEEQKPTWKQMLRDNHAQNKDT